MAKDEDEWQRAVRLCGRSAALVPRISIFTFVQLIEHSSKASAGQCALEQEEENAHGEFVSKNY